MDDIFHQYQHHLFHLYSSVTHIYVSYYVYTKISNIYIRIISSKYIHLYLHITFVTYTRKCIRYIYNHVLYKYLDKHIYVHSIHQMHLYNTMHQIHVQTFDVSYLCQHRQKDEIERQMCERERVCLRFLLLAQNFRDT